MVRPLLGPRSLTSAERKRIQRAKAKSLCHETDVTKPIVQCHETDVTKPVVQCHETELAIDAYNVRLGRLHVDGDTYFLFGLGVVNHWDAGWKVQSAFGIFNPDLVV